MMDNETYLATQQQILMLAGFVERMPPLNQFLERIERAETVAPITNPTLYHKGAKNLGVIKRLARATFGFQKEVRSITSEIIEDLDKPKESGG